jgi:uncharacterized membrane protein
MSTLRFAGDLPPILVAAIAVAAALVVMLFYLRESRRLPMPQSYLLPALRASAVVLVILILAGPVWHRRQVIGELGRVIFAVDVSESMSVTDSTQSLSPIRLERALRMLTGDEQNPGWLESLASTHELDVIAFSSGEPVTMWSSRSEEEIPTSLELVAQGDRTDLSSSLQSVLRSQRPSDLGAPQPGDGARRAAVVLMSDGRHNVGGSPVDVAERLAISGTAVHAIGLGSEDEPADVGIVNIERPDSVASDGQLAGAVVLKRYGLPSPEITVRIESGGTTVWQQTLDAAGDSQQSIPFRLDVEPIVDQITSNTPRGIRRGTVVMDLNVVVDPVDGDTSTDNNSMPFRVAASTRDRSLLILDGSSRWETRYIKNLFLRDPAWQIETVLCGPGTDMRRIVRGAQSGQLPNSREAWGAYDAVILGEIPARQWTEEDSHLLREFVTRGGGLIVIDGQYDRVAELSRDSLSDLIPVQHSADREPFLVDSVRPTQMGIDHPVMNLWGDKDRLAEFWQRLPTPIAANDVSAQEGAEVWANLIAPDGRQSPWLVTRLYGAGRVFYLSSGQTWRWRYKVADRFHARFWNQLLAAVMQPPYAASDDYVALGTDKIEYDAGESSIIRARLQDTAGKPVGDATVDALLIAQDRIVATVPLAVDDPARGTYQGQSPPLDPGAYDVRIRASGFDASALQATSPIWVGARDTSERRRVSLDENALLQVTEAAEGLYLHESSADSILDSLRPLSSGTVVESDILIWQSFYWFWAVIGLLAIEWWMRKRAGLV